MNVNKHITKVFIVAFILVGCIKGQKDRLSVGSLPGIQTGSNAKALGSIKVGVGKHSSSAAHFAGASTSAEYIECNVQIDAIDITTDGSTWIPLLSSPATVLVTDYYGRHLASVPIGTVAVTPGEYHGVRMRIGQKAPEVIFKNEIDANHLVPNLEIQPDLYYEWPERTQVGIGSEIIFTSANGHLIPFRVEENKDIWLVFDIWILVPVRSNYQLMCETRATTFPQ